MARIFLIGIIAIIGLLLGIATICGIGFFIYKSSKKSNME
jgi:hypothetical protein